MGVVGCKKACQGVGEWVGCEKICQGVGGCGGVSVGMKKFGWV